MINSIDRRRFLGLAATAGAALTVPASPLRAMNSNNKLIVGVMGMGGRGIRLAKICEQQPNVEVAYVCDVDRQRADKAVAEVAKVADGRSPKALTDFRRILDDPSVDALVIATSNHWHAPATILGCQAGKHVYVEKPCSHNAREGEWMVQAARKYRRRVQMGNQRRSWPAIKEAVDRLRNGEIGRVYHAQAWYLNDRGSIGHGKPAPVPDGLDYDLWQGPAPRRPFRDNILHYNWHWFWHWGNGELGNNGVHSLDLCRWGLGVDYPTQVTSVGGRYRYDDDQETPDTNVVAFTFDGGKMIRWEGLSCNRMPEGQSNDLVFHGENGSLAIHGGGYTVYDDKGKAVRNSPGDGGDEIHVVNFLNAVRNGEALTSEIEEGHKSTLLCHLGNISYRTGRTLNCSPKDGRILGDRKAMDLWGRDYADGWEERIRP
ncbi:MAG: Gfo/Idh/MocA family oxidoreductase [Armatimonadetes bacterium]|nr:Gfo/Idh/MocA family oxidoreductase [Armatimonadota bacterium]